MSGVPNMLNHIKNYLKGVLYGMLALLVALFIAFQWGMWPIWRRLGRENVGFDPVSFVVHYSPMPIVWIVALLVFALGFYWSLRKKISS